MIKDEVLRVLKSPIANDLRVGALYCGMQLDEFLGIFGLSKCDMSGSGFQVKKAANSVLTYKIGESITVTIDPMDTEVKTISLSGEFTGEILNNVHLGDTVGMLKKQNPEMQFSIDEEYIYNNDRTLVFVADDDLTELPLPQADECIVLAVKIRKLGFPGYPLSELLGL